MRALTQSSVHIVVTDRYLPASIQSMPPPSSLCVTTPLLETVRWPGVINRPWKLRMLLREHKRQTIHMGLEGLSNSTAAGS